MVESSQEAQVTAFLGIMRQRAAERIMELGTVDSSFVTEVLRGADWAHTIAIHCVDIGDSSFDANLSVAAKDNLTVFDVVKHVGTETEVNDSIMQSAEVRPFDAAFVSGAETKEGLLTACMVCHECLGQGGILGISGLVTGDESMSLALSSFREMFGDAYEEVAEAIFVKHDK